MPNRGIWKRQKTTAIVGVWLHIVFFPHNLAVSLSRQTRKGSQVDHGT